MTHTITSWQKLLFLTIMLTMGLAFSGCGSKEDQGKTTAIVAPPAKEPVAPQSASGNAGLLHDTGIKTFTVGVGAEDPDVVMEGISLLEQSALATPENSGYWLDLADAYINSGIALQYPIAIDIYWMLLSRDNISQDAVLARLAEAYSRVGNSKAAFAAGRERLNRASGKQANAAALHLSLLALQSDQYAEAATAIAEKARSVAKPEYLLMLGSALQEMMGNPKAAAALLDQALQKLGDNAAARDLVQRERRRLAP